MCNVWPLVFYTFEARWRLELEPFLLNSYACGVIQRHVQKMHNLGC